MNQLIYIIYMIYVIFDKIDCDGCWLTLGHSGRFVSFIIIRQAELLRANQMPLDETIAQKQNVNCNCRMIHTAYVKYAHEPLDTIQLAAQSLAMDTSTMNYHEWWDNSQLLQLAGQAKKHGILFSRLKKGPCNHKARRSEENKE